MNYILAAVDQAVAPYYAIAAAVAILVAAAVGAVCMCLAISKAMDAMARQPESSGVLRTTLVLGLVFLETTIIYALIVAIMIVIQLF